MVVETTPGTKIRFHLQAVASVVEKKDPAEVKDAKPARAAQSAAAKTSSSK